jgi:hypothetical protein
MQELLKKTTTLLGVAGLAVLAIYWFDLDDAMIRKSEPMMRKMAAIKKMSAQAAAAQAKIAAAHATAE